MKKLKIYIIIGIVFLFPVAKTIAQDVENLYQTRTSFSMAYKPLKKLSLILTPEFRLDEQFSLDKYLIETEAEYKPIKLISLSAAYRFIGNPRDNKDTEYFHRYDLSVKAKKQFGRFEPELRIRYSNYADDDATNEDYLRYKASLEYDIPNFKINPYIGAEAFQQLSDGDLYKMRYSAGFDYKLFKKNYLGLSYKLDLYLKEYKNRHIFCVGYKIKF